MAAREPLLGQDPAWTDFCEAEMASCCSSSLLRRPLASPSGLFGLHYWTSLLTSPACCRRRACHAPIRQPSSPRWSDLRPDSCSSIAWPLSNSTSCARCLFPWQASLLSGVFGRVICQDLASSYQRSPSYHPLPASSWRGPAPRSRCPCASPRGCRLSWLAPNHRRDCIPSIARPGTCQRSPYPSLFFSLDFPRSGWSRRSLSCPPSSSGSAWPASIPQNFAPSPFWSLVLGFSSLMNADMILWCRRESGRPRHRGTSTTAAAEAAPSQQLNSTLTSSVTRHDKIVTNAPIAV